MFRIIINMFHCTKCEGSFELTEMVINFNKKKCTYYIQKCCKECKNSYGRQYKRDNPKVLEKQREYKKKNKETIRKQRKDYHKKNKGALKKYKEKNPIIVKKCRNNHYKKHREKIIRQAQFSKRVRRCLFKESDKYNRLIQCSPNHFRKWIQWQFIGSMGMNNYGTVWELDHVIPQSILDKQSHHWQNIRPCFCSVNKEKKDTIQLYENVLQELRLYHFKGSLLPPEGNFWRGTRLTAVPNSKKEIHRDNPQPSP